MIYNFITILSWVFLGTSVVRLGFIVKASMTHDPLIALAEAYGQNPIGKALIQSTLIIIICSAWLFAHYHS